MQGRWYGLLVVVLVLFARPLWATNAYQTYFLSHYCQVGQLCNVYWPMDETSGTTVNDICNQPCGAGSPPTNLVGVNTPTPNHPGVSLVRGTSWQFVSGSSQYADGNFNGSGTGPADEARNFDSGCWVKTVSHTTNGTFLSMSYNSYAQAVSDATPYRVWSLELLTTNHFSFIWFNSANVAPGVNNVWQETDGTSTIANGTWYFVVGDWHTATTTMNLYVDATIEKTSTTTSGPGPDAVTWMNMGVTASNTAPNFLDGFEQDCFIVSNLNVGQAFCVGNGSCNEDDWPYNVKAPVVPKYRDDGWFDKFVSRGYVTGHFTNLAKRPLTFGPYPNFAVIPAGNIR